VDGDFYKKIQKDGVLHLIVYADGVKPADSFKKECWPIFVSLAELPRSLRDSMKNKIISGVYIGNGKPQSDFLFTELIDQIEQLNIDGINCSKDGESVQIKLDFYGIVMDGPARSLSINMVTHSGYYPCHFCLARGT
jgi:hypothetical protein